MHLVTEQPNEPERTDDDDVVCCPDCENQLFQVSFKGAIFCPICQEVMSVEWEE